MRWFLCVVSMVLFPVLVVSAQNATKPAAGAAGQPAAELNAVAEPDGTGAVEMDISEYQEEFSSLKGQVVKLTFRYVDSFSASPSGTGAARVCKSRNKEEWLNLTIPEDGVVFFDELFVEKEDDETTVYVQALTPFSAKALGTAYRKDNPAGSRYLWP